MELLEAIDSRFSARSFLDTPIPKKTIEEIIQLATRAPSGANMQPWKVYAISGKAIEKLINAALSTVTENGWETPEYNVYPEVLVEPYKTRRFETGMALYDILGIVREDKAGRNAQLLENFRFFGAPVGLIFTLEKAFWPGQVGDLGMFIQNVMLLAREYGLHTCPQGAWQMINRTVHQVLEIPDEEMIFCGMAIGHLDTEHPANKLKLGREPLESFSQFEGFED